MKLTPGKLAGLKAVSNERGVIAAAAMDQRGSLQKSLGKERGSAATGKDLEDFKTLVTDVLCKHASAILLDPEFGLPATKHRHGKGLLLAYEKTGYDSQTPGRLPDLLDVWSVRRLKEAGADCIKILLYYTPFEKSSVNDLKQAWIERIGEDEGRKLISIVYPERLPEGMDLMNETGAEWRHPSGDGRRSTASYLDLVEAGVTEASQAISIVLSLWRSEISAAELAASLGEGGLGLCDAEGAVVPPRVCRPLALLEAMRAEYRERTGGHVDVSSPGRYDATHEHEG